MDTVWNIHNGTLSHKEEENLPWHWHRVDGTGDHHVTDHVFSRVRGTVKWKEFGGEERQKRFRREGGCD